MAISRSTKESANATGVSNLLNKRALTSTTALLGYLALADFIFHIILATTYGYFRDELYYIVSGTQHLSLGYVDFPPFIAYVAAFLNLIAKDSLVSIHIVPALNAALLVFVSGMIARELGGGRKAQLLTALATMLSFGLLAFGSLFTPDSFDSLWWSLLAYLVIRIVRRKEPRLWVLAGIVAGVGLLTKLTIFFFIAALFISFLAIPSCRKYLRSKWIVVGAVLSIAFILPMTYWNFTNGWPMVHFYEEFRGDVSGGGPLSFSVTQLELISILNAPIFLLGLYFYLRSNMAPDGLRAFGLAYLLLFAFMAALNMKVYYLMPVYPVLFAGGAILIERSTIYKKGVSRWFGSKPYIACLAIVALFLAPIAMPILSPPTVIGTYGANNYQLVNADRFGWSAMVSNLSKAYDSLNASIKSQACIFTGNYGEASAVNFLGKNLGLPKAVSGHNNYYIWGPDSCSGQVLITIGVPITTVQGAFKNVTTLTTLVCQYCISYEQILPVYLCLNPNFTSVASVWPTVRHYD